ncbi:MAG: esterase-like activity of phytase family protein [Alphaproteobacteria bacterium]
MLLATGCAVANQRVHLNPDVPQERRVGDLTFRGGLALDDASDGFGGLSAIRVSPDGARLLALSDRGRWFEMSLAYDPGGDLAAADVAASGRLSHPDGRALRRRESDAEALAELANGSIVVAFELEHRLWRYPRTEPPFGQPPTMLEAPQGIDRAHRNMGMEALTELADGRLLVIAEGLRLADDTGAAWIGDGERWSAVGYGLTPGFEPTGAALLPDGDVIVTERRASLLGGFATRLVRLSRADLDAEARLDGQEIARLEPPLTVDNVEAVAARRDGSGKILIYLVSDDNFTRLQRTLLMMFELSP